MNTDYESIRSAEKPRLLERLRAAPEASRNELLLEYLRARAAETLGMEASELEPRTPLMALGLSSLKAIELKMLLEKQLEHPLGSSLLFDHPTLESLAPFLLERLGLVPAARLASPARRAGTTGALPERATTAEATEASALKLNEPLDIAAELAAELAALRKGGE